MSFLSVFDAVTPVVEKVLSYIPDPQQKLAAQQQLMTALQQWDSQQTAIDVEEAKNESIFVAGWRPFIGWVCGGSFAYKFVIQPFLIFILIASHSTFDYHLLPNIDWTELSTVLLGLLGLGGMRTFEKLKGI